MSWTESFPDTFENYNLTILRDVDKAWLTLSVHNFDAAKKLCLYQRSEDCFECAYSNVLDEDYDLIELSNGDSKDIIVSTKFPTSYRLESSSSCVNSFLLENDTTNLHCGVDDRMGEYGVYELLVNGTDCKLVTKLEPVNIYLPFLIPIFFYIGLGLCLFVFNKFKPKICKALGFGKVSSPQESVAGTSINKPPVVSNTPARTRLQSLDTFRGICIVIMIFVNDGAAGYAFLEHATWDGLYVADLVFPWFLWIMGVCIPVSIKSQVKKNIPKLTIFKRIIIRSLKLIAIGLILNSKGGPVELDKLRLPAVLQRFGICYFVAATSVLICASGDFVENKKTANKYIASVQDIVFIWKGWIVTLISVITHTCLTFFLEVPGCPTGYLGPGGLHKGAAYPGYCIGGAAGYIDRKILREKHIYKWPTAGATYGAEAYDPEGILGTFTSVLTVWLGVQAGLTLQVYPKHKSRLIRWAVWAVILGAIGAALCGAKQTGGPIPLNKNLWSLSFVLVLSCFALILLMALYVIIDVLKLWSGTPFFEPGMNSILLYIGHSVAGDLLPWHFRFKQMDTHFKRLVESLWGTSMWVLYSIYLFHQKFFWSL